MQGSDGIPRFAAGRKLPSRELVGRAVQTADMKWLPAPAAIPPHAGLTGTESLGLGSVAEFWAHLGSDLHDGITRARLAEWLVLRAVDGTLEVSDGGERFVRMPSGASLQVFATAFLENYATFGAKNPRFTGLPRVPEANQDTLIDPIVFHDPQVYAFAVHPIWNPDEYDAFEPGQWDFYLVPAEVIRDRNRTSASVSIVRKLATDFGAFGNVGTLAADVDAVLARESRFGAVTS